VDNDSGTNQFILTEIDEGDNDEEVVTEHILHDFMFQATNRGGLVTWDFGDGTTATGPEANHQFQEPGLYIVKAIESLDGKITTTSVLVTVHLETEAEVDNMECVCAPTAKDTIIPLSDHEGTSTLEGFVRVEHDGSSESCSLRNPLQECHVRVILQRLSGGDVVEESILFDETFRSNEKVVDFNLEAIELDEGDRLQLRLETDQIRDWHKPTAEWLTSAPIEN
jgi:PKD repeat protein